MKQLQCDLLNTNNDRVLECYNPSNFHLSFVAFALVNGDQKVHASEEGSMVRPQQRARFPIQNYDKLKSAPSAILFDFINDYGGFTPVELSLTIP